jgi:hypothetical protein
LPKRFLQGYGLLWRGMQLDADRPIHANIVPYMSSFCKQERRAASSRPPFRDESPPLEFYGNRERNLVSQTGVIFCGPA